MLVNFPRFVNFPSLVSFDILAAFTPVVLGVTSAWEAFATLAFLVAFRLLIRDFFSMLTVTPRERFFFNGVQRRSLLEHESGQSQNAARFCRLAIESNVYAGVPIFAAGRRRVNFRVWLKFNHHEVNY